MELKVLRNLTELKEALEDKELASEVTKLLGLFRIESQRVGKKKVSGQTGTLEYKLGWADAERFFNQLAAKEVKGVKPFRK
jgi:adenine-specific DNA methylase